MNIPTIIVGVIVAVLFITVLIKEIKKYKHGNGCSCDCSTCSANCPACSANAKKHK